MKNIIDYLREYGQKTVQEMPYNIVDAAIFSQIVYIQFEKIDMDLENQMVDFRDLIFYKEELTNGFRDAKKNRELMIEMAICKRYRNLKVGNFKFVLNPELNTSFAVVTFEFEEGVSEIVYRGTDNSIVGWKEDFQLAYKDEVLAQTIGYGYLVNFIMKSENQIRIMGHSKGGNIAAFVASMVLEQERIQGVYNFDGPGFYVPVDLSSLKGKYHKIVPYDSIVGMLMEDSYNQTVVKSNAFMILQHDPYSWEIEDGKFVEMGIVSELSVQIHDIIMEWKTMIGDKSAEAFVNIIFYQFEKSEVDDISQFSLSNGLKLLKEFNSLPKETKKMLIEVTKKIGKARAVAKSKE